MNKLMILFSMIFIAFSGTACAGEKSDSPVIMNEDVIRTEVQAFRVEMVLEGIDVPWGLAFLPDGSMLVTQRSGELYILREGSVEPAIISGVPDVYARGQGGLLDVELHPDYEENGWIYLSYSYPGEGGGHTAIMRARLDGNSLTDQEVLFRGEPLTTGRVHFGSRIRFDADRYMYFTTGDRGEMKNAQDLTNHSGKTLRLHDDGRIPADNPFVNVPDARPEIFTYGNRNAQGMDVHPETGEIWTHEHGPRGGDELNVMRAGKNYGWPEITYGINYNGTIITEDTARAGMEQPVYYWTPSIAPSGMAFVTGDRYPEWKGNIMVGALAHQHVHRVVLDGNEAVHTERILEQIGRVREVKMGADGYLYLGVEGTGIVRLIPE
ncbi:MAG: PQQ-dependent sugar dehydrogenase [Balneolaceae bacterium]|jgi:glucose/arabinose dehydrogenase|nr:MAG: PQQ-dependent sugar dehydrogenase [Balneolaceae bacterium]